MDETYVRVKGRWFYLYRVLDPARAMIDFFLSAFRFTEVDGASAKGRRGEGKAEKRPQVGSVRDLGRGSNPNAPAFRTGDRDWVRQHRVSRYPSWQAEPEAPSQRTLQPRIREAACLQAEKTKIRNHPRPFELVTMSQLPVAMAEDFSVKFWFA